MKENVSAIIEELARVSETPPQRKDLDDPIGYYERLARAVDGVSDDAWDDISLEAQDWTNAACRAIVDPTNSLKITPLDFSGMIRMKENTAKGRLPPITDGLKKSYQTKRRNIWGDNTVLGVVAELVTQSRLERLDPAELIVQIRERGIKCSVDTVDHAITSFLISYATLYRSGWIENSTEPGRIITQVEKTNRSL